MNATKKVGRFILCRTLLTVIGGAFHAGGIAAETACIDPAEYQRLAARYADLLAKYDLLPIAQEVIDVGSDTQDMKAELNTCLRSASEPERKQCDQLAKQYDILALRLDAIESRFYTALTMQEYLLTVQFTLEQPQCGK